MRHRKADGHATVENQHAPQTKTIHALALCRDLKAENILQSLNGSWVVCDFGSATTMNEVVEPARVPEVEDLVRRNTTAAYRAPEVRLFKLHVP